MGKWVRTFRMMALAAAILVGGAVGTHYLEVIENPAVLAVRELVLGPAPWKGFEEPVLGGADQDASDATLPAVHPLRVALAVRPDAHCVLRQHLPPPSDDWCNGAPADREKLLRAADWFLRSGERISVDGVHALMFPYGFPHAVYRIEPPWYSGMAQGMGGEALLAAYYLTNDSKYAEAALLAAAALRIPLEDGGVAVRLPKGTWFEEYASPAVADNPPLVLNGHIFALDFLYWLKELDPESWLELYQAGNNAVDAHIDKYLAMGWSRYDRRGNFANGGYHRLHIRQLHQLARDGMTSPAIEAAADRMESQLVLPFGIFERLLFQHNRALFFLWIVNSLLLGMIVLVFAVVRRSLRPGATLWPFEVTR